MIDEIKSKIKLIIWDLDETFWAGTLSEEGIQEIPYNTEIICKLTERGIISSICSKNNYSLAKAELEKLGVWEMFVFPHIDWTPKGNAVKNIITRCQLRAENVLFIDDNLGNRNEVLHFNEGINVSSEKIIPFLLQNEHLIGKDDKSKSRLNQYKLLEEKFSEAKEKKLDNIDFLKQSEIKIFIDRNIEKHKDRILELENRSNQLNFTKKRISESDFEQLQNSDLVDDSAVVFVQDKYGDYGLVGFYVKQGEELLHFAFSCRILNMFVENSIYKYLGKPKLITKGEIANRNLFIEENDYSFCTIIEGYGDFDSNKNEPKSLNIALIGGCDLGAIEHYFSSNSNIVSEFNYVNNQGFSVHREHTSLIGYTQKDSNRLTEVLNEIPFFQTEDILGNLLNSKDYFDVVIYSPLNDYSRALYRSNIHHDILIPFETFYKNWAIYNENDKLPEHLKEFNSSYRKSFSQNFTHVGPIDRENFYTNVSNFVSSRKNTLFIILTGSETLPEERSDNDQIMLERHIEFNKVLKVIESERNNMVICDVNKWISSCNDLKDNIRHYSKNIYHSIALEIDSVLKEKFSLSLKPSKFNRFLSGIKFRFEKVRGGK
jgi:FkbH-like protein